MNRESRHEAFKFYVILYGPNKFCVASDSERDTIYGMTPRSSYVFGDLSVNLLDKPNFEYLPIGRGQIVPIRKEVQIKSLAVK